MAWLEHRIPPPLVALAIGLLMWLSSYAIPQTALPPAVRLVEGLALAVAAGALLLPAVRTFRRLRTTVNPVRIGTASHLVTTGVYRLTRNPMYLGLALLLTALAFFLGSLWSLLGPVALVLYLTRFQIIPEERAPIGIFGQSYSDYCRSVRRWL
jgi:protein-S-isoprenylcysteine O-methyltransferase Ste14